jgi:predicted nucleic acid-binding protein
MYLDSAILVKLTVREPDTPFYVEMVDGQPGVWSSELAIVECWSALCRKVREGRLDTAGQETAWSWFETYRQDGSLRLQPVGEPILRLANRMLSQCQGHTAIRTLDAIHLATCEFLGAFPLQTPDRRMRAAAKLLNIPLGPMPGDGGRAEREAH